MNDSATEGKALVNILINKNDRVQSGDKLVCNRCIDVGNMIIPPRLDLLASSLSAVKALKHFILYGCYGVEYEGYMRKKI